MNSKLGFEEVWTPHVFRSQTWVQSGHYEAFKDRMYVFEVDDDEYAIKPMNCPGHSFIYKSRPRSYKDLPIAYSEFGTVYRNEQSGELSGLLRVRAVTMDDGHMYLMPGQIEEEASKILRASLETFSVFGIEKLDVKLSTRPEKAIGEKELWAEATEALKRVLESSGTEYEIAEGEGAFYGPKIDVDMEDSLGRKWQCATIQLDFFMPERLGLEYTGEDDKPHRPVLIHRAILGSLERFIAILLEHYQGKLPTWLSPEQLRIIPVSDKHLGYAKQVAGKLSDVRVTIDESSKTVSKKIREAWMDKVPYVGVVGGEESKRGTISVRDRSGRRKDGIDTQRLQVRLASEIERRATELGALS